MLLLYATLNLTSEAEEGIRQKKQEKNPEGKGVIWSSILDHHEY